VKPFLLLRSSLLILDSPNLQHDTIVTCFPFRFARIGATPVPIERAERDDAQSPPRSFGTGLENFSQSGDSDHDRSAGTAIR
jgi:hypothetical protein